jgi:hypothetical protein
VSALRSWNKKPVMSYDYSQNYDTLQLTANYDRLNMLGLDISIPIGQFVVRGEFAEYFNELQEFRSNEKIKKNTTCMLLGIDWYAGNDWTLMAQYYHKLINDYDDVMTIDRNTVYATLSLSKKLLRSTLALSAYAYIDVLNKASFTRFSADYSLCDQIHLIAGYDWFYGDKGMFSYYKNNSEYFVKAKFNF